MATTLMHTLISMTHCFNAKTKQLAFIFLILVGLGACKKDTQSVGAEFVSVRNQFNPNFSDTLIELKAYTVPMDSVITSKLTAVALGSIYDPYLGITKASLITQYGLPGNLFSWGTSVTKIDSLVLQLRFRAGTSSDGTKLDDFYGDKEAIHQIKVYELTEDISLDSSYYSTRKYKTDAVEIGSFTGKFNFVDSVTIKLGQETVIIPPHVRIKMSPTFSQKIFDGEKNGNFTDDAKFKAAYKGLVIVDETTLGSGQGAIVYLRLNSDVTALTAFYGDSLAADFPIVGGVRGAEASYNYYEHSNVPSGITQKLFTGNHRDTGYLQPLTGTKLRIELPNVYDALLSNPRLVINGAEIIFTPLSNTVNTTYTLPQSISLVGSDSLGRNVFLKDQVFEGSSYYGGQLSSGTYRFNIVRHLQNLLIEKRNGFDYNYGMNLIVRADDPLTAQRVILDTRKNSGTFKLKLTYTVTK